MDGGEGNMAIEEKELSQAEQEWLEDRDMA